MALTILSGKFKGRSLKAPKGLKTRPTQSVVRGAVFNICQHLIEEADFLDLYAGSGAMGLEALSQGAKSAVFVESSFPALQCLRENIDKLYPTERTLGASQTQIHQQADSAPVSQRPSLEIPCMIISQPVEKALGFLKGPFTLIYLDPPYGCSTEHLDLSSLLDFSGLLFLEERAHKKNAPNLPGLIHRNSRRFGDTLLHTYQKA